MTDPEARLAELVGSLSLATDAAAGLPPETALRTTLIAVRVARAAKVGAEALRDVYFTALLRFIGCTALAHEIARDYGAGEDQAYLAVLAPPDSKDLPALARLTVTQVGKGKGWARVKAVAAGLTNPAIQREIAESHCQLAVQLAGRLGMSKAVVTALGQIYERWDGRGEASGLKGEAVALPARVLHLAWLAEVHRQTFGVEAALKMIASRAGKAFDPKLCAAVSAPVFDGLAAPSVWELFLEAEPLPVERVAAERVETIAAAFATFADLKSPWTLTHSTGVARLAELAGERLRLSPEDLRTLKISALLHDLGRTSVPNGIWDKPGPLNPVERDRARQHAAATRQVLSLTPLLAPFAAIASMDHERADGSGYPGGSTGGGRLARVLQAADAFGAMTEDRPHRAALTPEAAAATLTGEAKAGRLDREAVQAVLEAAGQAKAARVRGGWPNGLSEREVEVVRFLARGLSNKEIGKKLFISPRTVQQHVRHIFEKTGVKTRAAAAVFATQAGLFEP